jgi:opacity protein-like surface antigen
MKKIFILIPMLYLLMFHQSAFGQDTSLSDPLIPGGLIKSFKIGAFGGINYPLSPAELTNAPKNSTALVQQSLLNGRDGLGYKFTYNAGLYAKYPFSPKFYLGANISYSGWKSTTSCNCTDSLLGKSENSLGFFQITIMPQYFFFNNFYVAPELNLNMFSVNVKENNSKRGNLDFSKSYTRLGVGIGVGYEYPITKKLALDISAKTQLTNLLFKKDDDPNTPESESLINSGTNTTEASVMVLSINLGILFLL